MKLAFLAFLVTLLCVVHGSAQSSASPSKGKFKCGKIINTFDKSKNETRVQLSPLILEGVFHIAPGETLVGENSLPKDDHGIALTFIYTYQGKVFSKPQSIIIAIGAESRWPIYETKRDLSMNLGGDVLNLGTLERTVQHTNMGYTREDLSATIAYE